MDNEITILTQSKEAVQDAIQMLRNWNRIKKTEKEVNVDVQGLEGYLKWKGGISTLAIEETWVTASYQGNPQNIPMTLNRFLTKYQER